MSPVERFTRDEASKYVWAGLALVALLGLVYAITTSDRAVGDERAVSQARAVRYVEQVIAPPLQGRELVAPITVPSALGSDVRRSILSDPRVSRVRIWSVEGVLLFSTDQSDRPRSDAGLLDPLLGEAVREGPITRSDLSDSGGSDDPERSLLRTYVPVGPTGVAEIDQTDAGTVGPVRTAWFRYQVLAAGVLLLLLVMIGLSLREPIEPINAGVPFADTSIPAGFSLIDDDRLHAVHEVYRLASERVARLQEKLREAEEARRGLEGYIQQVLSKAEGSAPRPAAAAPASSAAAEPAAPAPEPAIVQVPESEVVVTSPEGGAWATAPAGPLARAARDQKTVPETSRKKKPAAVKPKPAPKKRDEKPEPDRPVDPPPRAAKPHPTPEPERKEAAAVITPVAKPAPAPKPAASAPAPAPVAARAPRPAPRSPAPQVDDAKAHAAALETFIRLTESNRQPHDATPVDQGAVRAALARTAARKKPGGERLQLPEAHDESAGGPPAGSDERPTGRSSSPGRP
jgi:hypothetical protein